MVHKNWSIEKNQFGYYEAVNLLDCDCQVKIDKNINDLKQEIDNE